MELIRRCLPRISLRALGVLGLAAALVGAFSAMGTHDSQDAAANPAYGNVRPDPQTAYIIHNNIFQLRTRFQTCATTADPLCHLGGYEMKIGFDATKVSVQDDAGISSGGNTTTTLRDTSKSWKVDQWKNSRITLVGGAGAIGADGNQQTRIVQSNTANTITVTPAWDGAPVTLPNATTFYIVGGIVNSTFLSSTGRTGICQPAEYEAAAAEIHCVTLGAPQQGYPDGPVGAGQLTNLTLRADNKGIFTVSLLAPDTRVLALDGTIIPADIINGTRRIVRCPDADNNNTINVIDLLLIAQASGTSVPPGPSDPRNPDENGTINVIDLQITAGVSGGRCVQP
jgi:hypothetical protein